MLFPPIFLLTPTLFAFYVKKKKCVACETLSAENKKDSVETNVKANTDLDF